MAMNPQRARHMEGGSSSSEQSGHDGKPSIFIHSHSAGHTVHVYHADGQHEVHEHEHGDAEGMAEHVHTYLSGGKHLLPQHDDETKSSEDNGGDF